MKFFRLTIYLIISYFTLCFTAFAQSPDAVLQQIIAKTSKLYTNYPVEKVYLHFDKPYYAVGDTIWFKAYLTIDQHLPSPLSKIIYVDILNQRDSLMQSLKLQAKNSFASSFIPLSQYAFKKGNYRVIAYTNWMNNAGPDYFFNKNISIGDVINNDLATQINLKSNMLSKAAKISAGIYFKDNDGNPYAGKKISWTILKEEETLFKGHTETDKNGFADINFINLKNQGLDSANLITTIENNSKKQIYSKFPLKSISKPNDIQFFPEGGDLLLGIRNKIAFKALKADGLGIDLKGTITDNTNTVISEFTSTHLGMGVFNFSPEDGKTYTVKITYADGSTATPELPKLQTNGINLNIDNSSPNTLGLRLLADETFFNENKDKTFFIICKAGGAICFAAKTNLTSQVYSANIPKSKFPTGIIQATLFTSDGDPLSERIAFINHNDFLNIAVTGDKPQYTNRQKVKLNILAKNGDQPVESNFSVAVVDEGKVPVNESSETTLLTYLLLTSDIRGYIEKPNYYFLNPSEKTAADLDILLQTQGYRRFSYDGILNEKYPPLNYLAEQGIEISGTLRASSGLPIYKGTVSVAITDKNFYKSTITDADGKFRFTDLVFSDSTKVKLSARGNVKASDLVLTVDNDPSQKIAINYNEPDAILNIDSVLSAYLKNSNVQYKNSNVLKEVVIKDTKIVNKVSHRDFSSLASLASEPDHLVSAKDLAGCNSMLDCLKGLAMGMIYEDNNFYVYRDYAAGKKIPAQVFIRGLPVDVSSLSTVNSGDIESVEIFLKDQLGMINSAYGTNGAIVVNMKKAPVGEKLTLQQLKDLLPQKNEISFFPRGYTAIKVFYTPRYDGPKASQPTKLDTRTTIYWNPNVNTDKTGTASIEFYNADGKGTYKAIVEGLDKDGNLGRQEFRFMVK